MTSALFFENLLAWSAQVLVLVGIGAVGALALTHPRARLLFWQAVLAIAVLLPLLQPWRRPEPISITDPVVAYLPTRLSFPETPAPAQPMWRWNYLLPILAAGAIVRLSLLAAGVARLERR